VATRAVPKTAQGMDRRGTERGVNTVAIDTRLKTASAASNQSIAKTPEAICLNTLRRTHLLADNAAPLYTSGPELSKPGAVAGGEQILNNRSRPRIIAPP
jgi:hypothetical protein